MGVSHTTAEEEYFRKLNELNNPPAAPVAPNPLPGYVPQNPYGESLMSTYKPAEDPANYKVGGGMRQDPFSIPMAWLDYMKGASTPKAAPAAPEQTMQLPQEYLDILDELKRLKSFALPNSDASSDDGGGGYSGMGDY